MILIKYQRLLIAVCISILVVFSVGSIFIYNEQVVAQISVKANATDLKVNGTSMNFYNSSHFGVNMAYFTNWTQAPESTVAALNQNIEQSLRNQSVNLNQDVHYITFFFPNNTSLINSTSNSFIGLVVSNVSRYNSTSTIPVISQYVSEVKQTINNIGLSTNQTVNVKNIKDKLDGHEAEGLEYQLNNLTTMNISVLSNDGKRIITVISSSPASDYNRYWQDIQSMKDSIRIR